MTVCLCVRSVGIGSCDVFLVYRLLIGVRTYGLYGAPVCASLGRVNHNMGIYVVPAKSIVL